MVKGTTRQVIVVKGPDPKLFDQAIFLVRDDVILDGGVTEDELLKEAHHACRMNPMAVEHIKTKLLWALSGAGTTALLWLLLSILT